MKIEASTVNTMPVNLKQSTNSNSSGETVESKIQTSGVQEKGVQTMEGFSQLTHKPKTELRIDEKQWIDMIEKANKAISGAICSFEYTIHEQTKEIMVKVIDKDTKEIIREIPPEKILDMVAKMWEMAGIMVDERR